MSADAGLFGVEQSRGRLPTAEEVAGGLEKRRPVMVGCGARFLVMPAALRIHFLMATWEEVDVGWNVRVDPLHRDWKAGLIECSGFPAWAGRTEAEARATAEALDRLMGEGVSMTVLHDAQAWADAGDAGPCAARRAGARRAVAAHGWSWPEEPEEPVHQVEAVEVAPRWTRLPLKAFCAARPWRDVGCARCGAAPGARCEGRFAPGTEPYHRVRAEAAYEMWKGAPHDVARDAPEVAPPGLAAAAGTQLGLFGAVQP